jgi:hypothetical protein
VLAEVAACSGGGGGGDVGNGDGDGGGGTSVSSGGDTCISSASGAALLLVSLSLRGSPARLPSGAGPAVRLAVQLASDEPARSVSLLAGSQDGRVWLLTANGTLRPEPLFTPPRALSGAPRGAAAAAGGALARQGALVAFAVGSTAHVLLTHAPRARFAFRPCRAEAAASLASAGAAEIVSLAFDALPQRALWAATAHGDVLLFRLEHRQAPPMPPSDDAYAAGPGDDAVGPSQVFAAADLDMDTGPTNRGRIQLLSVRGIVLAAALSGGGGGLVVHAFSANATGGYKLYSHTLPGGGEGGGGGGGGGGTVAGVGSALLALYSAPAASSLEGARGRRRPPTHAPADGALLALANASAAIVVFDCFAPAPAPAFGAAAGGDGDGTFLGLVLAWLRSPLVLVTIAGMSFYCARGRGVTGGDGDEDEDGERPRRGGWQRSALAGCAALLGRTPMGAALRSQLAARDYGEADDAVQLRRSLNAHSYAADHLRGLSALHARARSAKREPSLAQQLRALRQRQLDTDADEYAGDAFADAGAGAGVYASNAAAAFAGAGGEGEGEGGGASDGGESGDDR